MLNNQSNISFNEGTEVTNSSEVISKDILLFRNIDELQKQNQKLVRLLHEVTDKKQSEEKNELEQKTKEYNEKLNLALRELEEFKIQREKHEQVLDEIRKQRDTYKQLLNSQQHQIQRNLQADTPTNFFTSTPGGLQKPKVLSVLCNSRCSHFWAVEPHFGRFFGPFRPPNSIVKFSGWLLVAQKKAQS